MLPLAPRVVRLLVLALALALGSTLAGCDVGANGDDDASPATTAADTAPAETEDETETETETDTGTTLSTSSFEDIPDLVDELQPSVVSIVLDQGEGSGVIVDEDTAVTNAHVVGEASSVQVVLASGRRLDAEVEAVDRCTDLAVLSMPGEDLPGATFADELPRVGELAIAMGNPLGFEQTVTAGIISGLHRAIPSSGQTPALIDLIQTDAPISPGNSGGALVNARGEVIGVNVAYIPPEARAVSIGFAIPAPTVTSVVQELRETGRVEHAYLGIRPADLTPQVAAQFGLDLESGVIVTVVTADSPAGEAGVEEGDVIVAADGEELRIVEDLLSRLREYDPGDDLELDVVRDGERRQLDVTLAERPIGC
jgi:S1-C subfamily serine protease